MEAIHFTEIPMLEVRIYLIAGFFSLLKLFTSIIFMTFYLMLPTEFVLC